MCLLGAHLRRVQHRGERGLGRAELTFAETRRKLCDRENGPSERAPPETDPPPPPSMPRFSACSANDAILLLPKRPLWDWRCRSRQGCRVHGRYRAAACTGAARSCPGSWSETARAASKPFVFGVIASFVYAPESFALCFVDDFFFFSVLDGSGQIREICTPQLIQTPQLHGLNSHGLHAAFDIRGSSSL